MRASDHGAHPFVDQHCRAVMTDRHSRRLGLLSSLEEVVVMIIIHHGRASPWRRAMLRSSWPRMRLRMRQRRGGAVEAA